MLTDSLTITNTTYVSDNSDVTKAIVVTYVLGVHVLADLWLMHKHSVAMYIDSMVVSTSNHIVPDEFGNVINQVAEVLPIEYQST